MKRLFALLAFFALTAGAQAIPIIQVTNVATNITNKVINNVIQLVGDVPKASIPGNGNSPATMFDWLDSAGDTTPGQISQYNTLMGSSLPQPLSGLIVDNDGKGNVSGYSLLAGSYYAVVHYGKGSGGIENSSVAWYLPSIAAGIYQFPLKGLGPNGFGGNSSVRVWATTSRVVVPDPRSNVPDGGTTIAFLGLSLISLCAAKRRFVTSD